MREGDSLAALNGDERVEVPNSIGRNERLLLWLLRARAYYAAQPNGRQTRTIASRTRDPARRADPFLRLGFKTDLIERS